MGEYRKVTKGETIEYDCGCIVVIDKVKKGIPISNYVETFCEEHDPTLSRDDEE